MSMQNRRGATFAGALVLVVVAFVAGFLICRLWRSAPPPPSLPEATRAPAAVSDGFRGTIDDAARRQILDYARALDFDSSDGASDLQRLHVIDASGAHEGPLVRIEPEKGAVALTRGQLAQGRIVARMENYDAMPYPKLGIPGNGVAYVWMDSTPRGHWRTIYIPDDMKLPLVTRVTGTRTVTYPGGATVHLRDSVIVHVNPDSIFRSRARWLWSDADEGTWASCTMTGCCFSNSKQFMP